MNTNSIWFRAALSVAAVWMMIAAYQAYSYYDGLIASERARNYDQSRYDECSNEKLDINGGQMQFRPPTIAEQETCRRIIDKVTADFENRRTLWDSLLNERLAVGRLFYRGLLPMGVLLLLVACWPKLRAGGVFYIDWLKNGPSKNG